MPRSTAAPGGQAMATRCAAARHGTQCGPAAHLAECLVGGVAGARVGGGGGALKPHRRETEESHDEDDEGKHGAACSGAKIGRHTAARVKRAGSTLCDETATTGRQRWWRWWQRAPCSQYDQRDVRRLGERDDDAGDEPAAAGVNTPQLAVCQQCCSEAPPSHHGAAAGSGGAAAAAAAASAHVMR